MFKKTRVRQIMELLQKNLSDREISNVLGVSRNSVARIRQVSDGYNGEWEELLMMTDDELYRFFYPDKFKPKTVMLRLIMHMFTGNSVKLGSRKFSYGKNTVKNARKKV